MIRLEKHDGVAVLRLAHGRVSALDRELCAALSAALRALALDDDVPALVLTGTGGAFSAGVDLRRVLDGGADYVREFLPALDEVLEAAYAFPKPLVAALNGHAIAGGLVLAAAADGRTMADGTGRVGAPELAVGVPFPWIALAILRNALPPQSLNAVVLESRLFGAAEALAAGVVDELVPADALLPRACARAASMARGSPAAFAAAKAWLRTPDPDDLARRAEHDRRARELWAAPSTFDRIRRYMEANVGRK
jgi:enoyl-CoA hydratase